MSVDRWFEVGGRRVGSGAACLIVAEVAQAHDGSLGTAHAFIEAVADAGANAVKFQTHIAAAESTPAEPWRVKFSVQDATRYDYWKRMEFTEEQWRGLAEHAAERGLLFFSSPFSLAAVELLERIGVPAWKVPSGEVTNVPMLERIAATGKPVILSSGMSSYEELDRAVAVLRKARAAFAVLQCTTVYPTPPERVGLNVLREFRKRYKCPVGLSDHSGTIFASLAAVTLGASLVEVHITFSRKCFGPDVSSSITVEELAELVRGIRFIEKSLSHPVDKDKESINLASIRITFGKSLVAARPLAAGTVLTATDLALKKPGGGLPPDALGTVIGRRLKRSLGVDELLREEDLV